MLTGSITAGDRVARWWFTDRSDGRSAGAYAAGNLAAHVGDDPADVRANRLALDLVVGSAPISWMGPVHGVDIAEIDRATSLTPNVDALATRFAEVPVATLGADCVPMLLAAGDVIIAAHVGWQGFAEGMTGSIVALLELHQVSPAQAHVVLGPAICGACYGIPQDRADRIASTCPEALTAARNGGPGADVRLGLAVQWKQLGATVATVGGCTYEDRNYFSHRRDGVTGRQAGVILWTP